MSVIRFRTFALVAAIAATVPLAGCGDDEEILFEDPATITVRNQTNGKILRVFFKTCGAASWGNDRLPDDPVEGVINVGSSKSFTVAAGCYDMKADHFSGPNPEPEPLPEVILTGGNVTSTAPFIWDVMEKDSDPA